MSALFPETITKRVNHGAAGVYGGSAASEVAGDSAPFVVRLYHDDRETHMRVVIGRAAALSMLRAWAVGRIAPPSREVRA